MSPLLTNRRSRPHADTDLTTAWADLAACKGRLAEFESSEDTARRMCAWCPVSAACLAAALDEEGRSTQYYREGVRGGLNAAERAALVPRAPRTPRAVGEFAGDAEQAETLLRAGELCDREIATTAGMSRDSVARLRRSLGLDPVPDPTVRVKTPLERFAARIAPGEYGHLLWVGGPAVDLGRGKSTSGLRLAFLLGYGREPDGMVKARCGASACVAWRHLADRSMRKTTVKAPRPAPTLPDSVGYLYGIEPGHWEGNENVWVPVRVIRFRITRKTPRRIFYIRRDLGVPEIGSVDRQKIEADGDVYRASSGWWEPDSRLYLAPPDLEEYLLVGHAEELNLADLKRTMADAHPDHGGTDSAFIAARAAYEQARHTAATTAAGGQR